MTTPTIAQLKVELRANRVELARLRADKTRPTARAQIRAEIAALFTIPD